MFHGSCLLHINAVHFSGILSDVCIISTSAVIFSQNLLSPVPMPNNVQKVVNSMCDIFLKQLLLLSNINRSKVGTCSQSVATFPLLRPRFICSVVHDRPVNTVAMQQLFIHTCCLQSNSIPPVLHNYHQESA